MSKDEAIQLSLFDEATPSNSFVPSHQEVTEGLAWSYSRRAVAEQCLRRYYNLYYGSNQRTATNDSSKARLRFLKELTNRYTRTGELAHLAIKTYFRKARTDTFMSSHQLVQFARRIFHEDQIFSRTYPDGHESNNGKYPKALLREYHYREPNADVLCSEAEDRMVQALTAFLNNEQYERFRRAGIDHSSLIEQRFKLPGFACSVGGIVDLAFLDTSGVTIVDWKIGVDDGSGDESLQLAVYGIWALNHFNCTVDDLRICKAYLGSNTIVDFHINTSTIIAARARIQQDIERLTVVHDYGQRGIFDVFTPCLQPAICQKCPFERECYD